MKGTYKLIILAVIGIAILGAVVLYQSSSMTLDQIIKNKDCVALDKWEEEHMFDDNLNISSEQMSQAMSLALECTGKVFDNMLGSNNSKSSNSEIVEAKRLLEEILETRYCAGINEWKITYSYGVGLGLSEEQSSKMFDFNSHCQFFAKIDEHGYDVSERAFDYKEEMIRINEIIKNNDCDELMNWDKVNPSSLIGHGMTEPILDKVHSLKRVCGI